jgi:hypothetical protein
VKGAIEVFSGIIARQPQYASAYNNRAQSYMLDKQEELALTDCDTALSLPKIPTKVKAKLFIQKSMILRLRGRDEESRVCMEQAAALGNAFAKKEAVKMNPYAAMCNAMLASAASALSGGEAGAASS